MSATTVTQTGTVTPGHAVVWTTDGVAQDGGPATNGSLTEVGITRNGGIAFGINSAAPPNAYVEYGVGVSSNGTITIYANSFNAAPAATLVFNINGVNYSFNPSGGGNVTGPGSSVSGDLVTFNGTGGNIVQDSGILAANIIQGPTAAVAGDLVLFNGTTGKLVRDGGLALPAIATIAALQAATTTTLPVSQCYVLDYATTGDGGGGAFIVGTSTTANGGTIINDASGRSWYRLVQGSPWSILWFGGSNNGSTDNLAAWNAMAAAIALQADGGTIIFPPGKYLFSANAAFTYPSGAVYHLHIDGYGAVLYWPNASGGMAFNKSLQGQQLSMAGMHVTTGQYGIGTGVSVTQTVPLGDFFPDLFTDVVFRGADNTGNGGSYYWSTCATLLNNSGSNWYGVTCYGGTHSGGQQGSGLHFLGTGANSSDYAIYHNINGGIFNGLYNGIVYDSYAQGVTISQSNFQNGVNGIVVPMGASGTLSQLTITASQFACTALQIYIGSAVGNVMISDNDIFGVASQSCILLVNASGFTITGNTCAQTSSSSSFGISIEGSSNNFASTISGNSINGANVGIYLATGVTNVLASNNALTNCTTPVNDLGTGNWIVNNYGVAPAVQGVSVSASPWTFTNGDRPATLYVAATTSISAIALSGGGTILPVATGANQTVAVTLAPHMAVVVTYTGTLDAYSIAT
jgi:hypothetical protein